MEPRGSRSASSTGKTEGEESGGAANLLSHLQHEASMSQLSCVRRHSGCNEGKNQL